MVAPSTSKQKIPVVGQLDNFILCCEKYNLPPVGTVCNNGPFHFLTIHPHAHGSKKCRIVLKVKVWKFSVIYEGPPENG